MYQMLEQASYTAKGDSLLWQPWLVSLFAGSDLLIFVSYLAIPIALLMFLRRRPDLRYRGLVVLFAGFILLCGLTHFLSIVTLWYPIYPVVGVVKLATGLVSAATAVVLFALVPKLVRIPSPEQLQSVVKRLEEEAAAHRATLAELEEARASLEQKVAQRTEELTDANNRLTVVTSEALHRGRNLLTVVSSLARQTARSAKDMGGFIDGFSGRIDALANAMSAINTQSKDGGAKLGSIIDKQLEPIVKTYGSQISIDGPAVRIDPEAAQQFGLALHELGTNAVKYGALSDPSGLIEIRWRVLEGGEPELHFSWIEKRGGTEGLHGKPAGSGGFGARLLTTAVPAFLGGKAEHDLTPNGLRYELRAPMSKIVPADIVPDREFIAGPAFAGGLG